MTRVEREAAPRRRAAHEDFLGIERIIDGQIVFRGGERAATVAVEPVDVDGQDRVERERLYLAYRALSHGLDFPFQILRRKARNTLDAHRDALNEHIRAIGPRRRRGRLGEGHASYLQGLVRRRNLVTERHYVVVPDPGPGAAELASGMLARAGRAIARFLARLRLWPPPPERPLASSEEEDQAAERRLADRCAQVNEGLAAARLKARRLDGLELA